MLILTKPGLPSLPLAADSLPCFWLILTSTTLPYLEKSSTRSSLLQLCGRLPTNSCWLSLKISIIESCAFFEANATKYLLVLDHLDLLLAEPVRPGPGLAGGPALAGAPLRPLVTSRTRGGTSETSGTSRWTSGLDGAGPSSLAAAPNTEGSPLLGHALTTNIVVMLSLMLLTL